MNIDQWVRIAGSLLVTTVAIYGFAATNSAHGQQPNSERPTRPPEFLKAPPSPFSGPGSDRLTAIIDLARIDDEVFKDAVRRAEQASRIKRSDERQQAEIEAALALAERDRDSEAIARLGRLAARLNPTGAAAGRLGIVRALLAYRARKYDDAIQLLGRSFNQLGAEAPASLREHLLAQILSTAGRKSDAEAILRKLEAANSPVAYPFVAIPASADWDVVRAAHHIATRKLYDRLWDERASLLQERRVNGQFFLRRAEARKDPSSEEFWKWTKYLADAAALHGDNNTMTFILLTYTAARAAADREYAGSNRETEVRNMLLTALLRSGDTEGARQTIGEALTRADGLKADRFNSWMFDRFAIAGAADIPESPDVAIDQFEKLRKDLKTVYENGASPLAHSRNSRAMLFHVDMRLARLYARRPDYWNLNTVLDELRVTVPALERERADFDGTHHHAVFVDAEAAVARAALGQPGAREQLEKIFRFLAPAGIDTSKPEDIAEALQSASESKDDAKATIASAASVIARPLFAALARESADRGDKVKAYDYLQRSFYLMQSQDTVCSGPEYPRMASQLAELALGLGRDGEARDFLFSETVLCADILSRDNTLRADTLVTEAKYRAKADDIYHVEYALRRAQAIYAKSPQSRALIGSALVQVELGELLLATARPERAASEASQVATWREMSYERKLTDKEAELVQRAISVIASAPLPAGSDPVNALFKLLQGRQTSEAAVAFEARIRRSAVADGNVSADLRRLQEVAFQLKLLDERVAELFQLPTATSKTAVDRRAELDRQRQALEEELRTTLPRVGADPTWRSAVANLKPVDMTTLRSKLGPEEAVVELALLDRQLVALIVRKNDDPQLVTTRIERKFVLEQLAAVRASVTPGRETTDPPAFNLAAAHRLFNLLIRPIEDHIKGVKTAFMVADDEIAQLPFGLLVAQEATPPQDGDYRHVDFLVRRPVAFATLPAANMLVDKQFRRDAATARQRTAFVMASRPVVAAASPSTCPTEVEPGDTVRSREIIQCHLAQLGDLGRAHMLVRALPRAWTARSGDIVEIEPDGSDTETSVKDTRLQDFRLIAFMAHTFEAIPSAGLNEPGLVFRLPKNPTERDDGLLTASEIANLSLDADLVMLLGCDTAGSNAGSNRNVDPQQFRVAGSATSRQVLSGLGRAFLSAGARSLLVTQWKVRPGTIPVFAQAFFANLAGGSGRAEAVRRAAADFLDPGGRINIKTWSHPFFWSPFTLVGAADPFSVD